MEAFGSSIETLGILLGIVSVSLYVDLRGHKNVREETFYGAVKWSVFWILLALGFYGYLWTRFSKEWADLYLAGYVLEKSLSVDNLMVFMAIFASFGIKGKLQRRILYWGILGALVFRAVFVVIGTGLFLASPWIGFVFAAIVGWSAIKMLGNKEEAGDEMEDYSDHWSIRLTGKLMPIYTKLHLDRFFLKHAEIVENGFSHDVTRKGSVYATPAFLCLMANETSDIAFSFDSVPAVISVTEQPILVYAAVIFAILGLRSLYFVLEALTRYLAHLEAAVIVLLFFVAGKMALHSWNQVIGDTGIHISPQASVLIVAGTLLLGVIASLLFPGKEPASPDLPHL